MKCLHASLWMALTISAAALPSEVNAQDEDGWEFAASINGWFPDISGETAFPTGPGGGDFTIDVGTILDNLKMTFQGSFSARKGRWGLFSDVVYMDLGSSESAFREGTVGGIEIPVDVSASARLGMESLIWTAAATYRLLDTEDAHVEVLAGFRYFDLKQTFKWDFGGNIGQLPLPGNNGASTSTVTNWDAIAGIRGRSMFGQGKRWFIPYHLDVGAGDSDLTWHAYAGIGRALSWGEIAVGWRYMEYRPESGSLTDSVDFNGPLIGAGFRW